MPRRKAPNTAQNPPSGSHKRQLSSSTTPTAQSAPGSRQSKRIKASADTQPTSTGAKGTPKKSKYFEGSDSDDKEQQEEANRISSTAEEEASGYDDEDKSVSHVSSATPSPSATEDEDNYGSDDPPKRRGKGPTGKRQSGRPPATATATAGGKIVQTAKEIWRQGVKAGLGPGKAVFIERPKPRGDGGIKYVPERIHPNTMAFLADLNKNNDREWMKLHDADYRTSWKDWESFVESLTAKIVEKDDTIPELPPKDLVFRVYRDIRFSPDPTPYKPFFSAAWSRTGRKGPYAGYYVQIGPGGKNFVGCGLWMPEAAPLALLRTDIDRQAHRIKCVLMEPGIRKEVLGGSPNNEKKAVKAFVAQNGESALKTKPKGYQADHPDIELLRLKNFTIGRKLDDKEIAGPECLDRIANLVGTMAPFVTYVNSVIMPDDDEVEDGASSDSSGNNTEHAE